MNRLVKGAIAGAAGIALLLGGAGTFAYWNSSATISGGTIVAGNLVVSDPGPAGVWTINGGSTPIVLAGYKIVPGDVLTYTKTMHIVATGDNLVATLGLGAASIQASTAAAPDVALAAYLTKGAVLTDSGTGITGASPSYTITPGAVGIAQDVVTVVTITFPKDGVAGFENGTKLGSVSLDALTVILSQV
ncbi:alternate-type signal peptide domain-containing protein [Subtercola frigoramans]|uniref:Alternate signal-mediated exported protein n=1 Tax=Subtercola frigoramans TaxID=120298 RepID=A0ABS2L7E9_9MICO|nr:alternate-type signal peptide domain-containing protein [Subtercola frigoramans]MBM7473008.1 alternate signal-mediated exported protein [Subtercola frigoramans]